MADGFQALASPVRRQILSMLRDRDMTAGEVSDRLEVSKPTLSGHFNVLKAADLIVSERNGTTITYSLNTSVAEGMIAMILDVIGHREESGDQA